MICIRSVCHEEVQREIRVRPLSAAKKHKFLGVPFKNIYSGAAEFDVETRSPWAQTSVSYEGEGVRQYTIYCV